MKSKLFTITFVLFFVHINSALSKELDDYLAILDTHPSIQSVLLDYESLAFKAEAALGLPDPIIAIGVENIPVSSPSFDEYLPSSKTIGLTQNIPNYKRRNAQRDFFLQSAHTQVVMADYNRSRLRSLFYTKLAEYKRIIAQRELEVKKQQVLISLKEFYEGEVVAGSPAFQKSFSVDLQLSEIEKRLNDLVVQQQAVEAGFVQLVEEVPTVGHVNYPEKKWSGRHEDLYPVLLAAENIDLARQGIKVADADFSPDFGLSATYKIREEGNDGMFAGDDWFSLQFRMTIPLWSSTKQQPNLEAARSKKRSADYKYKDVLRLWAMQMSVIESKKNGSLKNLQILEKKKKILEQSIATLQRTYSSGETSLEPVLLADINHLSLQSQIVQEREMYIRSIQEANSHIK